MRFYHQWPFALPIQPSIATIGAFDSIHRGHQKLLHALKSYATEHQLATTVISFEPLPREFFHHSHTTHRLQSFAEKFEFLRKQGIDQFVCLAFNRVLAELSAADFIEKILLEQLQVRALLVGEDFRFGKERIGDINLLKIYAANQLLAVNIQETDLDNGKKIASTQVRELLARNEFQAVEKILGRPYTMRGKVVHGHKRGRLLNFPTANVQINRRSSPLRGVYAVKVNLANGELLNGIANIGFKPTVSDGHRLSLEVFLFTEEELDLYGQKVTVEFVNKVRDEKKFDSLEALKAQITEDVAQVKEYFEMHVR